MANTTTSSRAETPVKSSDFGIFVIETIGIGSQPAGRLTDRIIEDRAGRGMEVLPRDDVMDALGALKDKRIIEYFGGWNPDGTSVKPSDGTRVDLCGPLNDHPGIYQLLPCLYRLLLH